MHCRPVCRAVCPTLHVVPVPRLQAQWVCLKQDTSDTATLGAEGLKHGRCNDKYRLCCFVK